MDAGSEFPAEGVERTATDLSENTPKRPRGEEEIVVGDINKLEAEMEGPSVKRSKVDNDEATDSTPPEEKYEHQDASGGQEGMDIDPSEKEEEEDDKTASKPDLMSPAFTRSRAYSKSEEVRTENSEPCEAFSTPLNDKTKSSTNGNAEINSGSSPGSEGRWRGKRVLFSRYSHPLFPSWT